MRYYFTVFFLLILTATAFPENYFNKPIYTDMNLSTISLPVEKDIENLLKEKPETKNIIINYLKTIEFTGGVVSTAQFKQYETGLLTLDGSLQAKIKKVVDVFISSKNYKISTIDVKGNEYFLPIKIIESEK
jgi:hypothetical protein